MDKRPFTFIVNSHFQKMFLKRKQKERKEKINMELTLKERLYFYKELIRNIDRIKDTIISLTMLYNALELDKECENELESMEELIIEHLDYIKIEIKEKLELNYILNKEINKITLEKILEL